MSRSAVSQPIRASFFYFYLFIECMQPKAMTLFTLERLSTPNTLFFTSSTMYLYEILFCSLILWIKYNKLDFNLILLLFYSSSSSSISLTSFHSSFCCYESESTRLSCYFLVAIKVFWIYLTKLAKPSCVLIQYLKLKIFWFSFCFNSSCSVS